MDRRDYINLAYVLTEIQYGRYKDMASAAQAIIEKIPGIQEYMGMHALCMQGEDFRNALHHHLMTMHYGARYTTVKDADINSISPLYQLSDRMLSNIQKLQFVFEEWYHSDRNAEEYAKDFTEHMNEILGSSKWASAVEIVEREFDCDISWLKNIHQV